MIAASAARAMTEKNIDLREQFPKHVRMLSRAEFDVVVNMSGSLLPPLSGKAKVDWDVPDPVMMGYDDHCLVMALVQELRREVLWQRRQ